MVREERPSSGLPGRPGLCGAQRHRAARLHETHGRVCDLLGQRRGLQDPLAGPGQPPRIADAVGQPAVPTQPMKGAFLSVLAYFLRHSFIAGFPTERVPKMRPVHSFGGLPAGDALRHGRFRA